MSQQHNAQVPLPQRPDINDEEGWKAYWEKHGQPWRTEPEIPPERQEELTQRRAIFPDIEKDLYPFGGMRLSRGDVEWLLATHEDGRGPIDWNDENQRVREGLDLRGADLRQIDLSNLPLTRLRGGITEDEWSKIKDGPKRRIRVLLEKADLRGARLEGSVLRRADLREASLSDTYLQDADLKAAVLEHARLYRAHLDGASLEWAHLEYAHLRGAILKNVDLKWAYLEGVHLSEIVLTDERHVGPQLADVRWEGVNLSVIEWSKLKQLGDEYKARQKYDGRGALKGKMQRVIEYATAVRANRQLATALQAQGLNEDTARFNYRAQKLQRVILRLQRKFGQYLFSFFLDLLTGYGYKPWRSFLAYLIVIVGFAASYYVIGQIVGPPLSAVGAVVFSMTSFHGRGFFPGGIKLDDPLTIFAAIEAFVGLLIEVTFIATLTRRLFGK